MANDGLSTFTTGTLNTGLTQTKSKTSTTSTTTTTTTEKGTTIRSDGGTVVVAANNVDMEKTTTTGDVLTAGDTVTAGGAVNETTLEDTSKTVTTTTSTSSTSTKFSGPDIKQAALDTVANAVGEVGANKIGDLKADGLDTVTHKVLHAANGAVQGAIKSGGDLDGAAAGAIGAAVGEIVAEVVDDGTATRTNEKGQQVTKVASIAAQLVAGLTGTDTNIAANAATNAVQNNRLLHVDEVKRIEALADGDKKKEKRLLAALCARTNCTIYEKDLSDGVTQEKALEAYHSIRANYASLEEMNAALSLEHKTLGAEYTKTGFFAYNSYSQTRDGYIEQSDSERLKALDRRFRPYGDQYEKNSRDAAAVVRHKETVELNLKDLNAGKIGFSEYLENVGMMRVGYDQLSLPAELDAEYLKLVEKDPKAAQLIADGIMTSDKVFTALELATLTKGIVSLLKGGPKALEKVNFKPKGKQNYDNLKEDSAGRNYLTKGGNGKFGEPNAPSSSVAVKQHFDGSYRTPDGKFASKGGIPAPGTKSAQEYTHFLKNKGFNVIGEELTVKGPVGNRRYDAVIRDDKGALWGIEYKSGSARKTKKQEFNDLYVNRYGLKALVS